MRLRTLFLYLIGSRQAILEIARNRHALWIGALFVLSAGFAREYDQEDLLHEPWYVLIPFGASLATSFFLYLMACMVPAKVKDWPRFWVGYRSFLCLFWMTAPLAWLYAIPYERFLSPMGATQANLLTLAVVATWRVFLMARVFQVIMGYRVFLSFLPVLILGSLLLFASSFFQSVSLINIMGGVRESDEVRFLQSVHGWVCFLSAVLFPLCCACLLFERVCFVSVWADTSHRQEPASPPGTVFLLALGSVLAWAFILPWTQSEQIRRWQVETALADGRIADAVALMQAQNQDDFPPQWDPPPRYDRIWRSGYTTLLWDVLEIVIAQPGTSWVRAVYVAKLQQLEPPNINWLEFTYGLSGGEEQQKRMRRIFQRLTTEEREGVLAAWGSNEADAETRSWQRNLVHGQTAPTSPQGTATVPRD